MKFSIALSILILAVGGFTGLMQRNRLSAVRENNNELAAEATRLGITVPSALESTSGAGKRVRGSGGDKAAAIAAGLVSLVKELREMEDAGEDSSEAYEQKAAELAARLAGLGSADLKDVILALKEDRTLPDETRNNILGFSIVLLAEDHPAAALEIYLQSSDLLGDSAMGQHALSTTLSRWAADNPLAALEWMKKNAATHPDFANESAKQNILEGAARNDPKLAFQLMREIQPDDEAGAVRTMVEAGNTPEKRTAILDALRSHLPTIQDEKQRKDLLGEALEDMARNISDEGFDSVVSWISKSKLGPEESTRFAEGLSYFNTGEDTGRWINWMSENLPEKQLKGSVENLIGQWTQEDYLAAGKWLSASPEGAAKNAAVATYAGTVAEYEPQTAVQWALTLPPGKERQDTLEVIYQNWPAADGAAAAAFAKEHGIEQGEPEDDSTEEQ